MNLATVKILEQEAIESTKANGISKINEYYNKTIQSGNVNCLFFNKCPYQKMYLMNATHITFEPIKNSSNGITVILHYRNKTEILCEDTSKYPLEESLASTYELYTNYLLNKYNTKRELKKGRLRSVHFYKPSLTNEKTNEIDKKLKIDEQIKKYGTETYPEDNRKRLNKNSSLGRLMTQAVPGTIYYIEIEKCPFVEILYPNLEKINLEVTEEGHKIMAIYTDKEVELSIKEVENIFQNYLNDRSKTYTEIIEKYPSATKHGRAKKMIDDACEKAIKDGVKINIKSANGSEMEVYAVTDRLRGPIVSNGRPTKVILDRNNQVIETYVPTLIILGIENGEKIPLLTEFWGGKSPLKLEYIYGSLEKAYRYAVDHGIGEPDNRFTVVKHNELRDGTKRGKESSEKER